ncbi:hypothetical protein CHS0354_018380 [Potamilus streckersoni]|uniref:SPOR domain-containing protein n=1 Tax=Potamilus streckersoni TaxID=2493646 RepID=A0AAE0TAJ2_9BIVA|nr:hypothetical protein CHS0354_018380 [Potamilus streckersoni]
MIALFFNSGNDYEPVVTKTLTQKPVSETPESASPQITVLNVPSDLSGDSTSPELIENSMKKDPTVNSVKKTTASDDSYAYVRLSSGDTLWDIAKATGNHNPWRWTDILSVNRGKTDYLYFNSENNVWYVIVPKGEQVKVPKGDLKIKADSKTKLYALQLAAYSESEKQMAFDYVKKLVQDGYHAYVYLTDKEIKSGSNAPRKYYRVRVGFFEDTGAASDTAEKIRVKYSTEPFFSGDYFITSPEKNERDGKLLDFGIQMLNPYAVEFHQAEDYESAVAKLRTVPVGKPYGYVVKLTVGDSRYAVRAGFFPNQQSAQAYIDTLNLKHKNGYIDAQVVKLTNIHEVAGTGDTQSFIMQLVPFALIIVIFYFFIIRPQQKKQKQHREMLRALKKGDRVILSSGIHGRVERIFDNKDFLLVSIADNATVKVQRDHITGKTVFDNQSPGSGSKNSGESEDGETGNSGNNYNRNRGRRNNFNRNRQSRDNNSQNNAQDSDKKTDSGNNPDSQDA